MILKQITFCCILLLNFDLVLMAKIVRVTGGFYQKNTVMKSRVVKASDMTGPKGCVKDCMTYTDCNAVNFHKERTFCELLDVSYYDDERINKDGVYFTDISEWKKIMYIRQENDACWPKTCPPKIRCIVAYRNKRLCLSFDTPCDNNQCQNGALCINSVKDYSCRCSAGYNGSYCERTCSISGSSYSCACKHGYYGTQCELTPCSSGPCRNEETCSISGPSFLCACKHGYYGTQCRSYACSPNLCRNGGACNPTGGSSYNCACTNGWYGTICNQVFRQRLTSPGFPVEYAANMHMTWKIAVGIGNIVALRFTDFKLESCCDFVKVYDNVESEDNILGSFNTAKVPPDVFTTGNVIVIIMTTDRSVQYKGFSADIYETIL